MSSATKLIDLVVNGLWDWRYLTVIGAIGLLVQAAGFAAGMPIGVWSILHVGGGVVVLSAGLWLYRSELAQVQQQIPEEAR